MVYLKLLWYWALMLAGAYQVVICFKYMSTQLGGFLPANAVGFSALYLLWVGWRGQARIVKTGR